LIDNNRIPVSTIARRFKVSRTTIYKVAPIQQNLVETRRTINNGRNIISIQNARLVLSFYLKTINIHYFYLGNKQ